MSLGTNVGKRSIIFLLIADVAALHVYIKHIYIINNDLYLYIYDIDRTLRAL